MKRTRSSRTLNGTDAVFSKVLKESILDESQQAFCADTEKAIRLLAPAGSGKTFSLLWRCLNLFEASTQKPRFLIFTFTRAARDELRDRIKSDRVFRPIRAHTEITTLNAWGYRRLRSRTYGLKLITTSRDQYFCVENLLQPVWRSHPRMKEVIEGYKSRARGHKEIVELIDYLKALGFRHDRYDGEMSIARHAHWLMEHGLQAHGGNLVRRLLDLGIIKLDGPTVEVQSQKLLGEIDEHFMRFWCEACEHMYDSAMLTLTDQKYWALIDLEAQVEDGKYSTGAHRFQHILVDEFQDINVLDLNLLKAVARFNKTQLTIVGDDDQAIYEWRGASPSFILDPAASIDSPYKTHILTVNYRSPKNIVELSQRLIKHNKHRVDKDIVANTDKSASIEVRLMTSLSDSINYVLTNVKSLLRQKNISKVALISRKRSQIIPYQIVFAGEGIEFCAAEDLHVFLSDAFRELREMLLFKAECGSDDVYVPDAVTGLLKLCDKVKRFPLKKSDRNELMRHLYTHDHDSLEDVVESLYSYRGPIKGNNYGGRMSESFADAITCFLEAETVSETIDAISENFAGLQKDYGKSLEDVFYADPPFLYLSDYATRYDGDFRGFVHDIERALATLAKIPPETDDDSADETWKLPLHLMTALRAKGKEFDVVFMLDANDGIWPIKYAETEEQLEQERRLFYVAFTRARQQVKILVN